MAEQVNEVTSTSGGEDMSTEFHNNLEDMPLQSSEVTSSDLRMVTIDGIQRPLYSRTVTSPNGPVTLYSWVPFSEDFARVDSSTEDSSDGGSESGSDTDDTESGLENNAEIELIRMIDRQAHN